MNYPFCWLIVMRVRKLSSSARSIYSNLLLVSQQMSSNIWTVWNCLYLPWKLGQLRIKLFLFLLADFLIRWLPTRLNWNQQTKWTLDGAVDNIVSNCSMFSSRLRKVFHQFIHETASHFQKLCLLVNFQDSKRENFQQTRKLWRDYKDSSSLQNSLTPLSTNYFSKAFQYNLPLFPSQIAIDHKLSQNWHH